MIWCLNIYVFIYLAQSLGIQQNLHVVLIMDSTNLNFTINCESNPALHKKCQVLWMESWSESSMKKVSVGESHHRIVQNVR